VSLEGVVGHQLVSDLCCEGWLQAATYVDCGQFLVLTLVSGF